MILGRVIERGRIMIELVCGLLFCFGLDQGCRWEEDRFCVIVAIDWDRYSGWAASLAVVGIDLDPDPDLDWVEEDQDATSDQSLVDRTPVIGGIGRLD